MNACLNLYWNNTLYWNNCFNIELDCVLKKSIFSYNRRYEYLKKNLLNDVKFCLSVNLSLHIVLCSLFMYIKECIQFLFIPGILLKQSTFWERSRYVDFQLFSFIFISQFFILLKRIQFIWIKFVFLNITFYTMKT